MPCSIGIDVEYAATMLRRGGLIGLPTETVYGLGAHAFDEVAIARVFDAKQRPRFDPLIVHIADRRDLPVVALELNGTAELLADHFWPGPLTLVLPRTTSVPDLVTAGLPTVAVRIPSHPMARELLTVAGVPVAAPSANPFGAISPTTAAHVRDQLGDRIDYILDGGPSTVGLESTVVAIENGAVVLLRPGGLTVEEIERVTGCAVIPRDGAAAESAQPSPGMLCRHYAPRTPLQIVRAEDIDDVLAENSSRRIGVMLRKPQHLSAGPLVAVEVLSSTGDLVDCAANFFSVLRQLDAGQHERILATPFPEAGLGRALNDRLRRASTPA